MDGGVGVGIVSVIVRGLLVLSLFRYKCDG